MRIVVIGGGIAGLAAAYGLARAGVRELTLLEREAHLFAHASGKNAAIFRPAEKTAAIARLALRSAELLDAELGERRLWLEENGVLLTASRAESLASLAAIADEVGIGYTRLNSKELQARAPLIQSGHAEHAIELALGGLLDPHAIATALSRRIRAAGGRIEVGKPARRVLERGGRAYGVELESDERVEADAIVIAGGAWASDLGASAGAALPLGPVRRHLVLLEPDVHVDAKGPTVWDAEVEAYFRPESGGVLASPGDAEPWPAEDPPSDTRALELLWQKLKVMAPLLSGARVRRAWACLRTFAPDKLSVVGADPRVDGLFWLAGLGGHGLTAGVAAGEVLAAAVVDGTTNRELSPARLVD